MCVTSVMNIIYVNRFDKANLCKLRILCRRRRRYSAPSHPARPISPPSITSPPYFASTSSLLGIISKIADGQRVLYI